MVKVRSDNGPPASVLEALERASLHTSRAGAELLAAARAILDAVSLALSGQPSEANAALGALSRGLDDLIERIDTGATEVPAPIAAVLLSALDAEIARWELRSATEPEARAVLRTFLAIREILWEFGVQRDDAKQGKGGNASRNKPPRAAKPRAAKAAAVRRKVKRIDVEG